MEKQMQRENPRPGEYYRHFKNRLYEIVTVAQHSETGESLVIYRALYGDFRDYARPLPQFLSEVDREKYPQATQGYRFERVGSRTEGLTEPLEAATETAQRRQEAPPLISRFLDAEGVEERLTLLAQCETQVDTLFLDNVSAALDLALPEGSVEERLYHLQRYLRTCLRYEGSRLRS